MAEPRYTTPLDPAIAAEANLLDEDAREYFEERAAIRQFSGGMDQCSAERAALEETRAYIARRTRPQ